MGSRATRQHGVPEYGLFGGRSRWNRISIDDPKKQDTLGNECSLCNLSDGGASAFRGEFMDHIDPNRPTGGQASEERQIFCPKCAAEPRLFLSLLDTRNGKHHLVFECRCGELIWQDE